MERFGKLVSLLILPLIAIIVYSALMSYFFKSPPMWTFEMSMFFFGSFFMLGAAYCHLEKKHVAVDVLSRHLPVKYQKALGIFTEVVVLFVALVFIYVSVPTAWQATLIGERSVHQTPFNPPVWWFRWIIPISCALIALQAFVDILALILKKPDNTSSR
ncbi:TRAP transporter small permease subunit [Desulfopila inferna]|uniref:TRAP transporter small permease subunit n=1 Tax=Desulfopila inferna TaxID=468528 RepID=UPI001962B3AC|nr:TRAP transporter small permease [Desulfopila inferna]MBM9604711.1 TRAP transporter small permease [Desulfopila inferna]